MKSEPKHRMQLIRIDHDQRPKLADSLSRMKLDLDRKASMNQTILDPNLTGLIYTSVLNEVLCDFTASPKPNSIFEVA